ncbi:MAG: CRTAC1 family protein, partial [Planctomycetota bacterium]
TLAFVLLLCAPSSAQQASCSFRDVAREMGVAFEHRHAGTGLKLLPETMGSGCALFDYDGDGCLDLYLLNGRALTGTREAPLHNALYHGEAGRAFRDVTETSGTAGSGFGMGCAVADVDNDGDLDLFVTSYDCKTLYRNAGDGTFADVTEHAGFARDRRWGTSAAFADIDQDGLVDLYVCHYLQFDPDHSRPCLNPKGQRDYCHPIDFKSEPDALYHNQGDGVFTDVTKAAGIVDVDGRGLGVVFGDYDDDGDQDVFVANDMSANYLFQNDGSGHFIETGLLAGVSYNERGAASAGMGTDFGDYDNDLHLDLVVTNFSHETDSLFHNEGAGLFLDRSARAGLASVTFVPLGFGTFFFDPDLDGDLDIFIANGHVLETISTYTPDLTYAQQNQVLANQGDGTFRDISQMCGSGLRQARVGRGAACGDIDNDGDQDIVVNNCNGAPSILLNEQSTAHAWLTVELSGTRSNRAAIGARVTVFAGRLRQMSEVRSGSSYLSHSDLRLHFGLGTSRSVDRLEVRWPSGKQQVFEHLSVPASIKIDEDQGCSNKDAR